MEGGAEPSRPLNESAGTFATTQFLYGNLFVVCPPLPLKKNSYIVVVRAPPLPKKTGEIVVVRGGGGGGAEPSRPLNEFAGAFAATQLFNGNFFRD